LSDSDLWLQTVAFFFEEVNEFNLNKDKSKIASKILGRVRNRLRDYFRELFKSLTAETELKAKPESIPQAPSQINSEEIDALLQNLINAGVITESDKYILLATKVYGKSIKELAVEQGGISYAAIRQRKARAQRAILSYFGKKVF